MTMPRLSLAAELAEIRAEIDRLQRRETALALMEHDFPIVPVSRPGWPIRREAERTAEHFQAHV